MTVGQGTSKFTHTDRKQTVVPQGRDIMTMGAPTKLAPDQHADADGVPPGRCTTHHQGTSLAQRHQAFFLPGRPRLWATTAVLGDQAVQAAQEQGLLPVRETRRAEAPALAQ